MATKRVVAYVGAGLSILLVTVGAGLFHPGAGLFAAGVATAFWSYLLGVE
jgi:hypothetical protein